MAPAIPDPDSVLDAISGSAQTGPGRHRGDIRRWLEAAHDRLVAEPPSWQALAPELARRGLRDVNGQPPTPTSLKSAWWRVRTEMRARRPGGSGGPVVSGGSVVTADPLPEFKLARAKDRK